MRPLIDNIDERLVLSRKIRMAALERGEKMADRARELGVSRQYVYQVVSGKRKNQRVRDYIESRLNTTYWPKEAKSYHLARIGRVLQALSAQVADMRREVAQLKDAHQLFLLAQDAAAKTRTGERSVAFFGGLRFADVRDLVIMLRRDGRTYVDIAEIVRRQWPDQADHHVTRSAVHRFCAKARNGKLKEFGISTHLCG